MELDEVIEGGTRLLVPRSRTERGPGTIQGSVFYNRQMSFNRDVSVLFFTSPMIRPRRALDAMSATGARAVRIMNEARPDIEFHANDWDPEAAKVIASNIEKNGTDRCIARNEDLRCLLAKETFDYIDLDPFGTPVPYLHSAFIGLRRNGILAITATDTASLAGTHVKKCLRRYQARPCRCEFGHEVGLRILLGYVARQAAMFDRGVEPLLCFYADHYFRLYVRLRETAESADATLDKLGYLLFDRKSHERVVAPWPTDRSWAGPLWTGDLFDRDVLASMTVGETLAERRRCDKYLQLWREELSVPYFYENNELSSHLGRSPVRMSVLLDELSHHGKVSRTHFSPTGFKSELTYAEVSEIYLSMGD